MFYNLKQKINNWAWEQEYKIMHECNKSFIIQNLELEIHKSLNLKEKYKANHFLKHLRYISFPRFIENIFQKLFDFEYYIRYRTTNKFHIVKTELKPGYYDIDHIMLYANFALLIKYIEEENHCHGDFNETVYYNYISKSEYSKNIADLTDLPYKRLEGLMNWINYLVWIKDNPEANERQKNTALIADELYRWWLFENKDDENKATKQLIRLIEIREGLWT